MPLVQCTPVTGALSLLSGFPRPHPTPGPKSADSAAAHALKTPLTFFFLYAPPEARSAAGEVGDAGREEAADGV